MSVYLTTYSQDPHITQTTLTLNYFKIRVEVVRPVIERFLEKISVAQNGCWEWTGAKINEYGEIKINCKFVYTHRFIYEYYYGSICPDLTLDHLCRNPSCCNPLHLEEVTLKVNILRGIAPSAVNSRKIHCLHGHLLSNDNLTLEKGRRRCKTCLRDRMRLSRRLKKLQISHL